MRLGVALSPSASALDGEAEYKRALAREILRSERQRVKVLATILTAILVIVMTVLLAAPSLGVRVPSVPLWLPIAIYLPFIVNELVVLRLIEWRLATGRDVPAFLRYLNALVETSLPSVVLAAQIHQMGALEALGFFAPFLYYVFIILSTLRLDFRLSLFTGAVAAIELMALALGSVPIRAGAQDAQLSLVYHASRSIVLLIGGLVAGWVGMRLRRQFEATTGAVAARDRVTNLFGQHVSPQVVDRLLAAGADSVSETRRVAVMFVDIRSFTKAARTRAPAEVVVRLDAAFAVLVEIVDRHGGVVNKFLGDGFLALFGAPLADARATHRAVAAAREMLTAIERSNADHPDWPIEIGIGLHVGDAVTGIVGSPRRKEYTVIGDTVNLAARIETLNKEFRSRLLLSDAVRREVGDEAADATPLGDVPIRGYDEKVPLWRLA